MKKRWLLTLITCAAVLLAATLLTGFWGKVQQRKTIRVGFVYSEDESTPYTANFVQAQRVLEQEYGGQVEILSRSNVLSRDSETPIMELVRAGCRIIFINMDTDIPVTMASENPGVEFCQISMPDIRIEGTPDNYHTFNGEIHQARYVSGIVAGMKLRLQVGVYLMNARAKCRPLWFAYPMAWGVPESGTPPT